MSPTKSSPKTGTSKRALNDELQKLKIMTTFLRNLKACGQYCMTEALLQRGYDLWQNSIDRVMRELGIEAKMQKPNGRRHTATDASSDHS